MDSRLRDLERESAKGDEGASFAFGRELARIGRNSEAQRVLLRILDRNPTSQDFKAQYVAARGYVTERITDEHLGESFLHRNLLVDGNFYDVVVGNNFLQKGDYRTPEQWKSYVRRNKKGIGLLNAKMKAAIETSMFPLREHAAFKDDIAHYATVQRNAENDWPLYGKLTYDGEEATLEEYLITGKFGTRKLSVPIFNQNYATLAREQPENRLGTTENAQAGFLQELFGAEPNQLVTAFQYFTKRRDNGNLREVRLWTPNQESRQEDLERALVLGVDGGFDIYCYVYVGYDGPAFGWSSARKNSP